MLDVLPLEQRAANTAADRYLTSLTSPNSRRAMHQSLSIVARLVCRVPTLRLIKTGKPAPVNLSVVPWAGVTPELALSARAALAAKYRPASANRHLAALRGVLSEAGVLTEALRKATKRIPGSNLPSDRALSLNDLGALLAACERDTQPVRRRATERVQRPAGARDAAVLALIFSGLRRAEVCALDVEAYQPGARVLRVLGKGSKVRDVPLHEGACRALDAWLAVRGREPGPLVQALNRGGRATGRLSTDSVYRICQERAAEAGVLRFAPHDARRYAAGAVLDVGAELSLTAAYLGHADVRTTARYDRRGFARLRRAVEATTWPGT